MLRRLLERALDLVAPPGCAACDAVVPHGTLFCAPCAATAEPAAGDDPGCLAAFAYGGAVATAILRLKYEDRPDLAGRFAPAVAATACRARGAVDLVVPVPLHPQRLATRGYNQAALLARAAARALAVPAAPRALARLRDTPRQARLDRATRLANVAEAFAARTPAEIAGRRVLLVDDVRTTGATLADAGAALHAAGAAGVLGLVVAQRR